MEDLTARAALVPAPDVSEGLTTSVSRSEIEEVLEAGETPIELILDLTRFSDGEATETRSVAVSWERNDLEQLLREAKGEDVILTFDREALREAMEADVEAHGIREKVLVLAVAATAAAGAAATAAAEPGAYLGTAAPIAKSLGPDDRAVSRSTLAPAPELGADDRALSRMTPAPAPEFGADDRAVPRATPAPAPEFGPDDRAVPRATPAPAPEFGPDDRAVPRATPAPSPDPSLSPDDRAVPRGTTDFVSPDPGTVSDPGISWAPSPAEATAVAGAIALAITGAFFVIGGRRRIRPGTA